MKKAFSILKRIIKYLWDHPGLAAVIYLLVTLALSQLCVIELSAGEYIFYWFLATYFFLHYRFDVIDTRYKKLLDVAIKSMKIDQKRTTVMSAGMAILKEQVDRLKS